MNELEVADVPVEADGRDSLAEIVRRMTNRTPEQKLADRESQMKYILPGRPLPEGKTIHNVVCGQWPGDETDEEINEMLEELS